MEVILAIDSGTQSSRARIYNTKMEVLATSANYKHATIHDHEGWSEHRVDDMEIGIASSISDVFLQLKGVCEASRVSAIGITNQRETIIAWDSETGQLLSERSIVWNDNRTKEEVAAIKNNHGPEVERMIEDLTGLKLATYYSATKMQWMLKHIPAVQAARERGTLRFGTVDSYIVYRLSGNVVHCSDATNSSRTLLFDITTLNWSDKLLELFDIPLSALPKVVKSAEVCAYVAKDIQQLLPNWSSIPAELANVPICGILGDQQAATLGHGLVLPGGAKFTVGTGGFLLMNSGPSLTNRPKGCTVSPLYDFGDKGFAYSLEGSIGSAGIGLAWMMEQGLGSIAGLEALLEKYNHSDGVIFVPAFTSLLSPYWKDNMRASIHGLTLGHDRGHMIRAFLESISLLAHDIIEDMELTGVHLRKLCVDGGMAKSERFLSILSDITEKDIFCPVDTETTARGAALAAAIGIGAIEFEDILGIFKNIEGKDLPHTKIYEKRAELISEWHRILWNQISMSEEYTENADNWKEAEV